MAEGMFKKIVDESGISDLFLIESRAVSSVTIGSKPHPETIKRLENIGASWEGKRSEQIKQADFLNFDFIICMDGTNEIYLKKHAGIYRDKIYLVRDINQETKKQNIPDPFYTENHDETFTLLSESLEEWLTMFKIHKFNKTIDIEQYRINSKPLFLTKEAWYSWNKEEGKYELTSQASKEAMKSYQKFYGKEN